MVGSAALPAAAQTLGLRPDRPTGRFGSDWIEDEDTFTCLMVPVAEARLD